MPDQTLTIAVVDPSRARAAVVEEGLRAAGSVRVVHVAETADLHERLSALDPDVVVIDLENPSRDLLEQMIGVSRLVQRPVAMFVDQSDASMMQAAVDAGISAYVVDGLRPERVKAVIDVAIMRFNAYARLQRELSEARSELADRKVIERAKGILMRMRGLSEDEAYRQMRRTAMNEKRRLVDIAQSIVTAADLLGGPPAR
jgi:two-component system, response regulator / RNA-binding antiterminator